MRVYKYMSLDSFRKSAAGGCLFLKASRFSDFNDPFEGKGVVIGFPSVQFAREWVEEFKLTELISDIKNDEIVRAACIGNIVGQFSWANIFDFYKRVVCFSDIKIQSKNELLMWSHYADSGRGVRLEIELDDIEFDLTDVLYDDYRPILNLENVQTFTSEINEEFQRYIKRCLLSKPSCWRYECEKRLVKSLDYNHFCFASPMEERKPANKREYLLKLPSGSLKEVIVGPKVSDVSEVQKVMQCVKNDGFTDVSYKRVVYAKKTYGYDIVNLFND
jgi:hypothetical protein